METKFNFKSQVATSSEQSERLLELGLKKETADMSIEPDLESTYEVYYISAYPPSKRGIPAWSLGRLWELYWSNKVVSDCLFGCGKHTSPYAKMIAMIEYDIEDGTFNKDYLEK